MIKKLQDAVIRLYDIIKTSIFSFFSTVKNKFPSIKFSFSVSDKLYLITISIYR